MHDSATHIAPHAATNTVTDVKKWSPFLLAAAGQHADAPRALESPEGIGDRLRAAAFAEIQAREAFLWAADRFADAPEALKRAWRGLAIAENRHLDWLLTRMHELGIHLQERRVSDFLWQSLIVCHSAQEFSHYMANAEERGRKAGVRFHQKLVGIDPISAAIFKKIADEEVAHIALAYAYFPELPNPLCPRAVEPNSLTS